jgi:sulfur carrier protein ThiS adenylyltransferase
MNAAFLLAKMKILLNENLLSIQTETTVADIVQTHKPDADLYILNGHPASSEQQLHENDRIVLIKRGEIPTADELEALLTARHTPKVHQRIKRARIGIAGVGGLGSQIAVALARCGVGALTLVDFDIVEPSNLNRQQYFIDQIGRPKVEALRDNLARINPYVAVDAHQTRIEKSNIAELFSNVDILVEAFDAADQKALLCTTFLQAFPDKYLVAGSGMAGFGPSNSITTKKVAGRFFLCGDNSSEARPGQGLMSPRVGIAAHHQANAVLRLLLQLSPEAEFDETDN